MKNMKPIQIDSRKIKEGDIFVAIKGTIVDGHDFLEQANSNGASLLVVDHEVDYPNSLVVEDTKVYLDEYLNTHVAPLFEDLQIIGITGTNGKTTTCSIIAQLLNAMGVRCATIGTLGYESPISKESTINTTPDIVTLYSFLLRAKQEGCKAVAMEVSSHALHQGRIGKIRFDAAGFTNLTLDHLDYHKTMETYASHKAIILEHLKQDGVALYNDDDAYKTYFQTKHSFGYGLSNCKYQIKSFDTKAYGSEVVIKVDKEYAFTLSLIGDFNIYNFMQALSCLAELGYSVEEMCNYAPKVTTPLGRSNVFKLKKGYAVVDFAHTPDAVENILKTFKEIEGIHIVTVIGSAGNRDRSKRPVMAGIATDYSDFTILTTDNPEHENPEDIIAEMVKGVTSDAYCCVTWRPDAVAEGVSRMKENSFLLLLGKGHETYQIMKEGKIPYSDIEEVLKYQ